MNSSRGTANLVMRCKFCKRDLTARKFGKRLIGATGTDSL